MGFLVCFRGFGSEFEKRYEEPVLISRFLVDNNICLQMPCAGVGSCGKCKIVASGELTPFSNREEVFLSESDIDNGIRLACQTWIIGEALIEVFEGGEILGIHEGLVPAFSRVPITGMKECFGAAVDIGTTTIAAYLYKLPQGDCIKSLCVENMQRSFGADVVSRIEFANGGGLEYLSELINGQIDGVIDDFEEMVGSIDVTVITANTTMLHLFMNISPRSIAVSPFVPDSLFGYWHNKYYLVPCISGYIGGDITCAVIASDIMKDRISLLIDIGTNGEMVLWNNGELICCSTPAGPVFEGAEISMGMVSKRGAIDKVYLDDGVVGYSTIEDSKPIGVCGTGLIDAVACILDLELLDEWGYLGRDFEIGDSKVFISARDIRQVQLAKSAIFSGIQTLLFEASLTYDDIDKLYIAGGFGSFINKCNAVRIGVLPCELLDKIKIIGNAAGIGASMILQSEDILKLSVEIPKMSKVIELSNNKFFMDKFIENMNF